MISTHSFMCSNTYSYYLNCQIQTSLYDWFDEKTNNGEWICVLSPCVYATSASATLITRICGIVEFLLLEESIFDYSFYENKSDVDHSIHELPKQILKTVIFPIEFVIEGMTSIFASKYLSRTIRRSMTTNLHRVKAQLMMQMPI